MRLLARKLVVLVITLLVVSFLTFSLTSLLPGDPCITILGPEGAQAEPLAACHEELGVDDPIHERYGRWLGNAVTGDLGRSFRTNQKVVDAVTERLPVTVELGVLAIVFALVGAIPLGMLSAYRAGTRLDRGITAASFGLLSVPNFMMAIFLIVIFAVRLGALPATGWTRFSVDPIQNLKSAIMPALALGIGELAVYTRLLRSDIIATLQEDFVTMARSKGLPTWRILLRHALRPSSFSLMTVVGVNIGFIISGSVIVEQIFALPGLGRLLFTSIGDRDLVIVQGVVLLIGLSVVMVNFAVDLLYSVLDPRIRHGRAANV
jgi:peptide/nickel transport system permease protein